MREYHPIVVAKVISNVQRPFAGLCLRTRSRTFGIAPHSEGKNSGRYSRNTTWSKAFSRVGIPGSLTRHDSEESSSDMALLSGLRKVLGHLNFGSCFISRHRHDWPMHLTGPE